MAEHGARITDKHTCPTHGGGPLLPPGMPSVVVEGLPAARLADFSACIPLDVVSSGAAMVLMGGLPATRVADGTVHGGVIAPAGAAKVEIGGPRFSIPSNVSITGTPAFQNKVVRDLYFLSTTPTGKELFRRLGASGKPVSIVPESDPQNSFCTPDDERHSRDATGTGSTVSYNPEVRMNVYDRKGNHVAQPAQVILGHEMCHALANAEGRQQTGVDPTPPPSEPRIDKEESQAIGTGSHAGDHPTENGFRQDLGLPERADHFRTSDGPSNALPPTNLRPGGY